MLEYKQMVTSSCEPWSSFESTSSTCSSTREVRIKITINIFSFLLWVWTLSWKRRGLSESRNIFEISLSWDTLMNTLIAWKSIVSHWIWLRFHSFFALPQMIHSKRQRKVWRRRLMSYKNWLVSFERGQKSGIKSSFLKQMKL